jgi:O-antigen/teichoic acid export membrane protein
MRVRRIFRNTVFSLAGHGFGDICSLLFLVVFARFYGSDVLGEFWYAMAVGAVLSTLVTRGTRPLILRDASQQPDMTAKYIGAAAGLQLLIAMGLLLLLVVLSSVITSTPRSQAILIIIVVYQIGYVLASVFRIYFNAKEEMHFNALLESGHKILILVAGIVALYLFNDPALVLLIYPFTALLLYFAGYALVMHRGTRPTIHLDWTLNRQWTVAAFPVFAYTLLMVLANRSGVIALDRATDAAAVGIFAAGDRLISACGLPFIMLTGAVFPIMSKLAKTPSELRNFVQTCLRISSVAAIPLACLAIMFSESIVTLVFGEAFLSSAAILGILALGIAFTAINSLLSMLLIATDHLWPLFKIYAAGLAVLFLGIWLMIDTFGSVGLAWSIVASKATTSLGLLAYISRDTLRISGFRAVFGATAMAITMTLTFYTLSSLSVEARYGLTLAGGLVALVVFRGVGSDDIKRLRQVIGK